MLECTTTSFFIVKDLDKTKAMHYRQQRETKERQNS